MTTRQQILRSSTPGQIPAAGARMPGELWTTFPDLQLGVIDASKNAQRLIAVRFFSATASYAAGDFVIQAGVLYAAKGAITAGAFNATQWTQVAAATDAGGPYLSVAAGVSTYLPLAGGTLTGLVTLSGPPSSPLHAATKAYADTMLPLAGGTMLAPITLSGSPTIPLHAATKAYVDAGAFVPVAGGTMTGPLILNANPSANLGAVTRQYVDALPVAMNDNRLINGDMRIDARNNGASGTAATTLPYTVDRWFFYGSQVSKGTWGRNLNGQSGPTASFGFPYCLGFQTSSAYASVAADQFIFCQSIEADAVSDFMWGTAGAQPATLSFFVFSSLTGAFSGCVQNYAGTRSYPFSYSIPAAGWYKIVVTIPGDTAGTWVMSGNAGSVNVVFDLGSGSSKRGPVNVWASAAYNGVTGAVNVVATLNATFYVTGVKLEIGSVATPYNRQSLAKSMADCQRYYQTGSIWLGGYAAAGQGVGSQLPFAVIMRASPTVTPSFSTQSNCSGSAASTPVPSGFITYTTVTGTSSFVVAGTYAASVEL